MLPATTLLTHAGAKSNSSPDVLRATPKVDSPSKLTTSARNLNATSTTNTSPNTATSNNGGIFRKMKNKAKTMLGGSEASNAPGSMVIGTPTFVRHETHVGFSSATGAFEVCSTHQQAPLLNINKTRNLPPELQWLFEELDGTLKAMGVKGITKDEAKYLLNTLIAAGVGKSYWSAVCLFIPYLRSQIHGSFCQCCVATGFC